MNLPPDLARLLGPEPAPRVPVVKKVDYGREGVSGYGGNRWVITVTFEDGNGLAFRVKTREDRPHLLRKIALDALTEKGVPVEYNGPDFIPGYG